MTFNNPFARRARSAETAPQTCDTEFDSFIEHLDKNYGSEEVNAALGRIGGLRTELDLTLPPAVNDLIKEMERLEKKYDHVQIFLAVSNAQESRGIA